MDKVDCKPQELESACKVLETYCHKMKNHIDSLVARIDDLEMRIANAFEDYCRMPYYLHAILMHDGLAESGHYYSFIFDRKLNCWWRFSDHDVRMETEEDVFKEAIGGQQNKAAYSLMYINRYIVDLIELQPFSAHRMNKINLNINNNLLEQVVIANNSFTQQQDQYQSQKKSDQIKHRFMLKKKAQE
jgi:ubiquitin carboxyl-terminal hydrolase 25/28